jgi:hypothetical protein
MSQSLTMSQGKVVVPSSDPRAVQPVVENHLKHLTFVHYYPGEAKTFTYFKVLGAD